MCCLRNAAFWLVLSHLVIFLDSSYLVQAQATNADSLSEAYLGIHGSGGIGSYREDLLVPLSFDGPSVTLGAVFSYRAEQYLVNSRLKLLAGFLANRFSHSAYSLHLELRSSWLARVSSTQDYGTFWLGPCLPLQINNVFFDSWDDSHLYWLTAYMLGISCNWENSVSDGLDAQARLDIPLVGFISRPPAYRYSKQDPLDNVSYHFTGPNTNLRFATVDTYRSVFVQALLRHKYTSSAIVFGLEFEYRYCSDPSPVQTMHTALIVAYEWRL